VDEIFPNLIRPNRIINAPDEITVNEKMNRILMAVGYPRVVELGFLNRIVTAKGDFDVSMHIHPSPLDLIRTRLNKLLLKQKADLMAAESKGLDVPSLRVQYEDTLALLRQVEKGEEKVFDVSLYVNVKGKTKEELDLLTGRVKAELDGIGIISKQPTYQMREGLISVLPLNNDRLNMLRSLTTSALAECFPFTSSYLTAERGGVIVATSRDTGIPIIKDVFALTNPNILVAGTSGGGKSYFSKLLMSRMAMKGVKVLIVDPNGEYGGIVRALGGEEVVISRESENVINIFDLMDYPFDEKRLSLLDALVIMLGTMSSGQKNINMSIPQKSLLDDAISIAYKNAGISNDKSTWKREPPVIEDLYEILDKQKKTCNSKERRLVYESLVMRLKPYVDGAYSFLNKRTRMNADANIISFNIKDLPRAVRPTMMYMILDYVYSTMRKDPNPKMVVVDEAWSLLSQVDEAPFLLEMVKTSRKFHMSLLLIVQELNDLVGSKAGKSILANTSSKYFFRQDPAVIDAVVRALNFNANERKILMSSGRGEGLMIADTEHMPIKVVASPNEDRLVNTTPGRAHMSVPMPHEGETQIDEDFDTTKGLYRAKDITEDQITILKSKGYVFIRQSVGEGRGEYYLIRPNVPQYQESLVHLFFVKYTEQMLLRFTKKVELFQTRKPDVVFEDKDGKKVAIEVETGTTLNDRNKMDIKVKLLKKDYGERYFILVSEHYLKKLYVQYGEVVTRTELAGKVRGYF
jgi:hypothetical protein